MHIHRSALLPLLSLLLVTGCKGEEGIDTTIIQGQVQLTPTSAEEGADGGPAGPNDEGFIAMPALTYRYMTVAGSAREYTNVSGTGDVDTYLFRLDGAGDTRVTVTWATDTELYWPTRDELLAGELPRLQDAVNYVVEIVDPGWTDPVTGGPMVLATIDEQLTGGSISFDWADAAVPTVAGGVSFPYAEGIPDGTSVAVRVTARRGIEDAEDSSYQLAMSGLDPNGGRILVGAYLIGDLATRGDPVAGAQATGFWWDEATKTWTGWYQMQNGTRRVVECEVGDADCMDSISGDGAQGGAEARLAFAPDGGGTDGGGTADGGGTTDGGGADGGGTTDGGFGDGGGTTDGGFGDGGGTDGGGTDGGGTDGGGTDGGGTDGGGTDGGGTDGGATDGGATDGGGTDGGATDGGAAGDGGGGDTAEPEDPTYTGNVNEGVDSVYILAGTFSSLQGSIPGGTLYSTTPVFVELGSNHVVVETPIVIDDLSPKVYGWTFTEDSDGSSAAPVALPTPTGPGFVDVIEGTLLFEIDDPEGANQNDGFSFVPVEAMGGLFTASWPDGGANLDLYVMDATGTIIAAAYLLGDTNPEGFNAIADFGVTFEPGETYIIDMEAWLGSAGDKPYTIEIEWTAP